MVKIEKGIKIPPKRGRKRKYEYPWGDMKVGDSFEVSGVNETSFRVQVSQAASKWGIKLTTRQSENGLRVWRIK